MTAPARLVALEGIDGAGTTSQTQALVAWLGEVGVSARATREPSDGPIGQLLRRVLRGELSGVPGDAMALLFAADRVEHLAREVEPALAAGTHVVSDRWYHSSLAYQAVESERAWVRTLNARARPPDLTILLDLPAEVAAARRAAAGRAEERYDALPTQRAVAARYRELPALLRGERIEVLDGARPFAQVGAAIRRLVGELCGVPAGRRV